MKFTKEFFKNPRQIGSLFSSSKNLSRLITDSADLTTKSVIVELGPGTGIFTNEIINKKSENSLFFAIELNKVLFNQTKNTNPNVIVYNDSASEINKYLSKHGTRHSDCIISALPWAAFDNDLQDELLNELYIALKPGGIFLTIALLPGIIFPSGIRFKKKLIRRFQKVSKSRIVWRNLPPAFVYICSK
ncbi:MAG: class I SAM-dependent methyltransferase [Dehalococcoidia bacterium]|jgi:phosphatidylethanolamine/phosphatidyl-N-methylethanolamine N-methyltransferase|nr:SAM-dependent methyltransferase [SAR202 cluster bacterium]|tara:strand:+ start:2229 stop:2795 length:567 start_codon:yes stop_codon:yes gene_type:complete